ncbi:MAG TPA: hypothetical protein VGS19_10645 [Streptosporangiaceae bacterium]|nr:hypothetical protein [Streptosporangiaceae bacterium]
MSMPYGERRRLRKAERALCAADPRLVAMFSVFADLTTGESLPQREQFPPRRAFPVLAVCAIAAVAAALARLTVRAARAVARALQRAYAACHVLISRKRGSRPPRGAISRQQSPWG